MTDSTLHPFVSQRAAFLAQRPRNRMMALAAQYKDTISLGRGDPDLATPAHIIHAAHEAALRGETHYAPILGIPPLREAISAKLKQENKAEYEPDEVMVTTGGQEAMNIIMQSILNPGDEVLCPNPGYGTYDLAAHLAGGVPVQVPLDRNNGFQLDPAEVEKRITPRTKLIVIISPNNPTGTVLPKQVLERIADIAIRHNLLVISDEIYEKILFDDAVHYSIASFPGMKERTIVVNGFSKAYSMTGWRVGWMAAPRNIMKGMEVVKHTFNICTPAPNQWGALAAITGPQDCVEEAVSIYARRRLWLLDGLASAGLSVAPHGGSIFIFPDIRGSGLTSEEFAMGLLEQEKVVVYPGSDFGPVGEGFLRMSILAPDPRFREAVSRIVRFAQNAKKGEA